MSKAVEYLKNNQSQTRTKWRENAEWRRENEQWLRYSRAITIRVLKAMDEKGITQSILAANMGCTQQYVSNLLRGNSNMTLDTIARLEIALKIEILQPLITNSTGRYSTKTITSPCYLNDKDALPYQNSK